MQVYLFKKNKKTGQKKLIETLTDEDEARDLCKAYNKMSENHCYEFTKDAEYLKN